MEVARITSSNVYTQLPGGTPDDPMPTHLSLCAAHRGRFTPPTPAILPSTLVQHHKVLIGQALGAGGVQVLVGCRELVGMGTSSSRPISRASIRSF